MYDVTPILIFVRLIKAEMWLYVVLTRSSLSYLRAWLVEWWYSVSTVRKVAGSTPTSSRHVGNLGKSFTPNCLYDLMWRPAWLP